MKIRSTRIAIIVYYWGKQASVFDGEEPRVGSLTKLFVTCVFILNSNYRVFQLDRVKQLTLPSYRNQRVWADRSLFGHGKTGPATGEPEIGTVMNKRRKGIIQMDVLSPWYPQRLSRKWCVPFIPGTHEFHVSLPWHLRTSFVTGCQYPMTFSLFHDKSSKNVTVELSIFLSINHFVTEYVFYSF